MAEEGQRVALVGGVNRGIGLEIVHQLAEKGITVILGSRGEEEGQAAAEGLSGDAVVRQLTRIQTSELEGSGILVNSVSPGWFRLDMGGSEASRSDEEGADEPVWAATPSNGGPTGGFFRVRQQIAW